MAYFCIFRMLFYRLLSPKMHAFWCFFLSFFWDKKLTAVVPFFKHCIMLSFFNTILVEYFCYISIRICTRVEKVLRNGHRKYVQKSIPRNLFQQIRRALGDLRNFFRMLSERPCMQRCYSICVNFRIYLERNCTVLLHLSAGAFF